MVNVSWLIETSRFILLILLVVTPLPGCEVLPSLPSAGSRGDLAGAIGTSDAALPVAVGLAESAGMLSIAGQELRSSVKLTDGTAYRFPFDFVVTGEQTVPVVDPVLGPAEQLSADFASRDGRL